MRAPRSFMAGLTVCGYVKGLAGVSSLQPTAPPFIAETIRVLISRALFFHAARMRN